MDAEEEIVQVEVAEVVTVLVVQVVMEEVVVEEDVAVGNKHAIIRYIIKGQLL